jgi:multidrug resistance efflux pump
MASPFSRTLRALALESKARTLGGLALVTLLLAGWTAWFFRARVAVYEVTDSARLEVERAVHPVEAPVTGRVVISRLVLGRHVEARELLVELDTEKEQRRLEEERRRLAGLQPQLEALRRQIGAEEDASVKSRLASRTASDEARARKVEAETGSRFADEEAKRLSQLHERGGTPELNALRARASLSRVR